MVSLLAANIDLFLDELWANALVVAWICTTAPWRLSISGFNSLGSSDPLRDLRRIPVLFVQVGIVAYRGYDVGDVCCIRVVEVEGSRRAVGRFSATRAS